MHRPVIAEATEWFLRAFAMSSSQKPCYLEGPSGDIFATSEVELPSGRSLKCAVHHWEACHSSELSSSPKQVPSGF